MVEYLSVLKGGDHTSRRVHLSTPLHPFLDRALSLARVYFDTVVVSESGQNLLAHADKTDSLLAIIDDDRVIADIKVGCASLHVRV